MSNDAEPAAPKPTTWMGRNRRALLIGGPAAFAVIPLFFYPTGARYQSTDDAYIQAARVEVSTNISAPVSEVDVRDNQVVRGGQVLFKLDPRNFEVAVADAQAQLDNA